MKSRIASLALVCLALASTPAAAQLLYDDGPINGTIDAWTINFGFLLADSFVLANNSTVGGFTFGVWEYPGDTVTSVQWSISSLPNGGTLYGSGVGSGMNLTDQFLSTNQYGYNIDRISVTGLNVSLAAGPTYWLTLQNGITKLGNPLYWDENDGVGCTGDNGSGGGCPSQASPGGVGSDPPEAFDIYGTNGSTGTTPEPSSFLLFGSGILGCSGLLRRKFF